MMDNGTPHESFVEGIVVPIDWGPDGEVLRVAILTHDEGEYEVGSERAGAALLDAVRQQVEARVRILERPGERDLVTVLSFAVLDDDPRVETLEPVATRDPEGRPHGG